MVRAIMVEKRKRRKATLLPKVARVVFLSDPAIPPIPIWWQMLIDFLKSYQDETADATLPVSWIIDRLYEFIAEKRRDKVLGQGIFLGTIHSAKGMEFSHVFILDGDWIFPHGVNRKEEERRILYVAMTRAKETLVLMKSAERPNPFINELKGDSILTRRGPIRLEKSDYTLLQRYEFLGLNYIFMDYAGGFPSKHAIHKQLAKLEVGHVVLLIPGNPRVGIQDQENCCVGRLANNASVRWNKRIDSIHKVRVVAMVKHNHNDPEENFKKWIKADTWELPLLEIVFEVN